MFTVKLTLMQMNLLTALLREEAEKLENHESRQHLDDSVALVDETRTIFYEATPD